jgi:hypothetical protein
MNPGRLRGDSLLPDRPHGSRAGPVYGEPQGFIDEDMPLVPPECMSEEGGRSQFGMARPTGELQVKRRRRWYRARPCGFCHPGPALAESSVRLALERLYSITDRCRISALMPE